MRTGRTPGAPGIAYDDAGSGEPALVLLPGWCSSRERWRAAAGICAARRRVVALEWRGHGDSDPSPGDFGAEELVEDAVAVIDACKIETFVPCSASHAGWVAIELRRRYPERVPAIVHADWLVTRPPQAFSFLISQLVSGDWEVARQSLFRIWAAGEESPELERTLAVMAAHGEEMWRRAGRAIAAAYARFGSPLEALAALEPATPVLHLYGQPQQPAYLEGQERFAARHPWFAARKLETMTHFSMVESPEQVAEAVDRFVASA